ncbi:hypothetical protein ABH926_001517 [Catenulispora sp. GP43]|uniref:hypothetical protein n=1 Tax=Catenulispora sp. GP43 TaxID=3156263 RepID=UPI003514428F
MNDEQYGPDTDGGDSSGEEALFADLGRFEVGTIPVDATLKQGRTIRRRRRVVGGGALAIAAALSIGVPVAVAGGGSGYSSASGGPDGVYAATSTPGRVTVNPTILTHGKGQFSGTIDGKKWSIGFDNKNCYYIEWTCGFDNQGPDVKYAALTVNASAGEPDNYTLFLQKQVATVNVTLADGEVLHFEAVPVAKTPVALFALPPGLGVAKIEVFDARGAEIAFSSPFSIKGSFSVEGRWYKPGETPPPAAGPVELTRGKFGADNMVITAYTGPSGPCIVTDMAASLNADCTHATPITGSMRSEIGSSQEVSSSGKAAMAASGLVAPQVARLQLDYADGTSSPIDIKSLGGYRFFAYVLSGDKQTTGVTAFDAAGKPLPVQTNGG